MFQKQGFGAGLISWSISSANDFLISRHSLHLAGSKNLAGTRGLRSEDKFASAGSIRPESGLKGAVMPCLSLNDSFKFAN